MLFLCSFSSTATSESFVYVGFVLSGFGLLIVANSCGRVIHLAVSKYNRIIEEINSKDALD